MSDKKRRSSAAIAAETDDESESLTNFRAGAPTNEELARLLAKKESLENSLLQLERQIYALETSYLEDTHNVGNVLKGWEGYLSSRTGGSSGPSQKKRFKEEDRLFSLSSVTGLKSVLPADDAGASSSAGRGSASATSVGSSRASAPKKQPRERTGAVTMKKGPGRPRKKTHKPALGRSSHENTSENEEEHGDENDENDDEAAEQDDS